MENDDTGTKMAHGRRGGWLLAGLPLLGLGVLALAPLFQPRPPPPTRPAQQASQALWEASVSPAATSSRRSGPLSLPTSPGKKPPAYHSKQNGKKSDLTKSDLTKSDLAFKANTKHKGITVNPQIVSGGVAVTLPIDTTFRSPSTLPSNVVGIIDASNTVLGYAPLANSASPQTVVVGKYSITGTFGYSTSASGPATVSVTEAPGGTSAAGLAVAVNTYQSGAVTATYTFDSVAPAAAPPRSLTVIVIP